MRPRYLAALALPLLAHAALAPKAQAQVAPTFRTGSTYVACGDIFAGPRISHPYSAVITTHDSTSVSDPGGYIPPSSASSTYDAVLSPSGLSLSAVGASMRGPIPAGGTGSASASATANDQWNFDVTQTSCFTLDGAVNVFVSTGALTTNQGFQMGVDGTYGAMTLANGAYAGYLSSYINSTGSVTQHWSGTIYPGHYFMTISGDAEGNGAPRSSNYNTYIALSLGPPAAPSAPASAVACSGHTAPFSITPVSGATYIWQVETSPNTWQSLANDPAPLPCGGSAHAAPINSPSVQIGVQPCPGRSAYRVRCLVSTYCGSTPSDPATLTINSADFNGDGDTGTDADIEAFFACLSGSCCPTCGSADFNGDGDVGTDADIESFFRVLGGGPC